MKQFRYLWLTPAALLAAEPAGAQQTTNVTGVIQGGRLSLCRGSVPAADRDALVREFQYCRRMNLQGFEGPAPSGATVVQFDTKIMPLVGVPPRPRPGHPGETYAGRRPDAVLRTIANALAETGILMTGVGPN